MQRIHDSDSKIESEIQAKGLTAPRVTPQHVQAAIASEHYFTAADGARYEWLTADHSSAEQRDAVSRIADSIRTSSYSSTSMNIDVNSNGVVPPALALLTFCVLVLRNGFTVTGESACASPENFDAEIGRKIARENAVNKIWMLEGYLLKQRLSEVPEGYAQPIYPG